MRVTPRAVCDSTTNGSVRPAPAAGWTATFLEHRHLQLERVDDLPVVLKGFGTRRLVVRRRQRQAADLEQLGRGEKHHVDGEPHDGIDERALLEDEVIETEMLCGNGGGEPRRAGADDDDVANGHIWTIVMRSWGLRSWGLRPSGFEV